MRGRKNGAVIAALAFAALLLILWVGSALGLFHWGGSDGETGSAPYSVSDVMI